MLCYECVVYSTQSVKSVRLFERKLTNVFHVQSTTVQYSNTSNHDDDHDHDKHDHNNQEVNR